MCVNYQCEFNFMKLAKFFKAKPPKAKSWIPKVEGIWPGYEAPVILVDPVTSERTIALMIFGMPLFDIKKKKMVKHHLFNAKSETITEKKTFQSHFRNHRILVPAYPGFNEPEYKGEEKVGEWLFGLKSEEPFALAGIWGTWNLNVENDTTIKKKQALNPNYDPPKEEKNYYSIITINPNKLVGKVHDRMPVLLDEKNWDAWLDPKLTDEGIAKSLLVSFPADKMQAKAVVKV
jgi:putative SOS response-associated peptidase YedK